MPACPISVHRMGFSISSCILADKDSGQKGSAKRPSFPSMTTSAIAPRRLATKVLSCVQDSKKVRGKGSLQMEGITEKAVLAQTARCCSRSRNPTNSTSANQSTVACFCSRSFSGPSPAMINFFPFDWTNFQARKRWSTPLLRRKATEEQHISVWTRGE